MATLSLKHIYKVYDGTTKAVNDFNMEIRDREFIVFVGPSGCGKSTTLRMIAGLEDISAGELRIDDVIVNDMEPRDRNIAMVFQNYALYPHMSVYENMAFSLKTAHEKKDVIHQKVMEAAAILGITEYLDRKPRALSGGQRQRVALGRAIVRSPKVFLFDEPLSNLDAKLRAAMRAEIIRLYERLGTTFIYVTHDQVEAMTMGSRIVVMRGGYVQQIDTPKNLYNHPANRFVAGFIGTPRMNFWDGTLTRQGNSVLVSLACGVSFTVALAHLDQVSSRYMDGQYPVVIGARPDDIILHRDGAATGEGQPASSGRVTLPITADVVEALGGETLIYGTWHGETITPTEDLPEEGASSTAASENTKRDNVSVICKAGADAEVHRGDRVTVSLNTTKLHIFDRETEQSLKPRIPTENLCTATVREGVLSFAGQRFPLPAALAAATEGDSEVRIPVEAILPGTGSGRATVKSIEPLDTTPDATRYLYRLAVGDETLFATETLTAAPRYHAGDTLPFDIDFHRISIAAAGVEPLPGENILPCRLVRDKQVDDRRDSPTRGRKIYRFFFDFGDRLLEVDPDLCQKLFSCKGTAIFRTELEVRFPPDAVTISPRTPGVATETTLPGRVTEVYDYGRRTFARVAIATGRATVIAPCESGVGDAVHVSLDQSRLTVYDREVGIIIV